MKKTAKKSTARRTLRPRQAPVNKTAMIVALMKRKGGVTRDEVLEVTGWKAVSMQQVAEKAHVKLQVDTRQRPLVYRAK